MTKQPARFAALKLAVDLQLFDQLAQSGDAGVSVAELASGCKADAILICKSADVQWGGLWWW